MSSALVASFEQEHTSPTRVGLAGAATVRASMSAGGGSLAGLTRLGGDGCVAVLTGLVGGNGRVEIRADG